MAYENQDHCEGCGIAIPHVEEDADPAARLCDACYEKAEKFSLKNPVVFCKRTDYPKLGYIIHRLNKIGIPSKLEGHSFHADHVLYVDKENERYALGVLNEKFGRSRRCIDDLPDDDQRFLPWAKTRPYTDEDWGYVAEAVEESSIGFFDRYIAGDR